MSVEVNLVGTRCGAKAGGLSCTYCYQGAVRRETKNDAGPAPDFPAIEKALRRSGGKSFSMFGGEPLLADRADVERVWKFGLATYGRNGVQTSGRPIDEEWMALFRKYKVHVGFSIDGPGELNDARRAGTIEETRVVTDHSISMLLRCLREGIGASVIVTLSKMNASAERLPLLLDWFRQLDVVGLQSARLHILERDGFGERLALTVEENTRAFRTIGKVRWKTLRFELFSDIRAKLRDVNANASCVWNHCDPWSTRAVHGIDAQGERTGCHRVHKDGKTWRPLATTDSTMRARVLWNTDQDAGGCRGCRFFLICGGHCPGTAIDGDWRKRTVDCETWYSLLEGEEKALVAAGEEVSTGEGIEDRVEAFLADDRGVSAGIHVDVEHGDVEHEDHEDAGWEVVR